MNWEEQWLEGVPASKVEVDGETVYEIPDPKDLIHSMSQESTSGTLTRGLSASPSIIRYMVEVVRERRLSEIRSQKTSRRFPDDEYQKIVSAVEQVPEDTHTEDFDGRIADVLPEGLV